VAVDHYPAQRFDEDQRSSASLLATRNAAFNETIILLEYLPPLRKFAYVTWAFAIGASDLPGFAQCLRLSLKAKNGWNRLPSVFRGRLEAIVYHIARAG